MSLQVDSDGNLFATGSFRGTVDFDPGSEEVIGTSSGLLDGYLTKFDKDGKHQWTRTFGGTEYLFSSSLFVGQNDGIYLAGNFNGTVDFDPSEGVDNRTSLASSYSAFLTRFASNGDYQGTMVFGDDGTIDVSFSVAQDFAGNLYFAGNFRGSVDFDVGPAVDVRSSAGLGDIFITRYDSSGNYQWTKIVGGGEDDTLGLYPIAIDKAGNVFIAGSFSGSLDFDPSLGNDIINSNGAVDVFLSKYNLFGNYLWTKTVGGNGFDGGYGPSVTADSRGNVYLWSRYVDVVDFGDGLSQDLRVSLGSSDLFLNKYDSNGNRLWTLTNGGEFDDYAFSVGINDQGDLYMTGSIGGEETIDFDPGEAFDFLITPPRSFVSKYNVDVGPPDPPVINSPAPCNTQTDDRRPSFYGTAEANGLLGVRLDGHLVAEKHIGQDGSWTWSSDSPLDFGIHHLLLRVKDTSLNESDDSISCPFEVIDDLDKDGLSTEEERELGTNPHDRDTDNDGVDDKQEIIGGTNPNNADTDADGVGDGDEKILGLNPINGDTDQDGVLDGQEITVGSNPLDRGSFLPDRDLTVCAEWNGFLGMFNILENISQGANALKVNISLHNLFGKVEGITHFPLQPESQHDLLVHDMLGFTPDLYGLICSRAVNGVPGDVDGRLVFYKQDLSGKGFQFAYAVPLGNGLLGSQFIHFNTYQPSLVPEEHDNLAANWIHLTNLEGSLQTGDLVFYDRTGRELYRAPVKLGPYGRFDFSAHDLAGRSMVGLVEWLPNQKNARFMFRNARYYYKVDGINTPLIDDFDGAVQLEGTVGNGQILSVPLDTENSSAILEISNTLNQEVRTEVSIYSSSGGSKASYHEVYKLKPYSTRHLITDSILQGLKGIAVIRGHKPASVIATAMHYRRIENQGIKNVYSIQAREALGGVLRGSYNTFLNQGCFLLLSNPTNSQAIATVSMKRYDGSAVELGREISVPGHGLTTYDLCAQEQANTYGVVKVTLAVPNTVFATVLRIGTGEQYRFATLVRE